MGKTKIILQVISTLAMIAALAFAFIGTSLHSDPMLYTASVIAIASLLTLILSGPANTAG